MTERPTRLPAMLTKPMSWLYGLGAAHKARGFDRGRGVVHLDRPVISVGNLSVGGTGKSPMVHHIVRTLIRHGHSPAIAMRGYKAKPGTLGDEGMEHRVLFPEVPIVAQPDRVAGLRALFATDAGAKVDCIVLDDGFQHRRIARDLDLVLIDASRPPDRDALLPHGFLREPIRALARADAFVLTHTELVDATERDRIDGWLKGATGHASIAHARHHWSSIEVHERGEIRTEQPGWLKDKRVLVACAIGNPRGLINGVQSQGGRVISSFLLADHRAIAGEQLRAFVAQIANQQPDLVLMTRKDLVKLKGSLGEIPSTIVVPRLELAFDRAEGEVEAELLGVFRPDSTRA
ncbi:MAG: tetraacyldisaccharide 4'-kinase [Phycisphaerales bacterium]|nr:tetraacyldisaccharide 4'-kinase [Phycisphaerales bacterium]